MIKQEPELTWYEVDEPLDIENKKNLFVFLYGKNKEFMQMFYGIEKEEAIKQFSSLMNCRISFEVEHEGWEADAICIPFSDGAAWIGSLSDQANQMLQESVFKNLTGNLFRDK